MYPWHVVCILSVFELLFGVFFNSFFLWIAVGKEDKLLPYLLFLQGGPGFECARPTEAGGWVKKACEEYRVVLLDQALTRLSPTLVAKFLI